MVAFRKHIYGFRLVAIIAGGTFLSACMKWRTEPLEPERFRTADSTQTLRLSLMSGDTLIVHSPVITGDSLVGMQKHPGWYPDSMNRRISVPLASISQVEARKPNGAGTVALIVGGLVVGTLIYASTNPCLPFCNQR